MTNLIIRADGSQIDKTVILSCEHESQVNTSSDFSFGCSTPDCVTITARGDMTTAVSSGEKLEYYRVAEDGTQTKMGVYYAEKPTIVTKDSYSFVAYDSISLTDKNLSAWLYEKNQTEGAFPITVRALVAEVCAQCGVEFKTESFPNEDFQVKAFYADNITGRDILGAAAELAGKFLKADIDGKLYFGWFAENPTVEIAPGKSGAAEGVTRLPYFQGQLSFQKFTTASVERIQLQQMDGDIGVIYPDDATGVTYQITGNILLTNATTPDMRTIAENLFSVIQAVVYTPFSVKISKTSLIKAGDIINVSDSNGHTFKSPVFKVVTDSSGTTVESDGTESRESGQAVNSKKYENLTGRVFNMEQSYNGLKTEAKDLQGKYSTLNQTVEELSGKVAEDDRTTVSTFEVQYAQGDSQEKAPEDGWSTESPKWQADKFIWQRTKTVYRNKTVAYSDPVCIQGAKGADGEVKTVSSIAKYYQISDSATEAPTSWINTFPIAVTESKNLWAYEVVTYSDKSKVTTDPHLLGTVDKDVGTILNRYLVTNQDSGITLDSEGWTPDPESISPEKPYLWNYDQPIYMEGAYGEKSTPRIVTVYPMGLNGKDGVSVRTIIPEYYISTSKSVLEGGSWDVTPPEWVEGKYIWSRSHIFFDDGTDQYTPAMLDNSVNSMGEKYTEVKQTADKISWLVKDGDSETNFTLTSRAMSLATSEINLSTQPFTLDYNVNAVSGAGYTFNREDDGYYKPTNVGVNSSRACCRIYVTVPVAYDLELQCLQSSEDRFDYGIIGKVDVALPVDSEDPSKILHSFKGVNAPVNPVSRTITIPAGTHFFDVQYGKDSSSEAGSDWFKFKLPENLMGSSLTIKSGSTVLSSANIVFQGAVTFEDLANNSTKTVINGGNITTGEIRGIEVITEAYWVTMNGKPIYRLARLDAGGVHWYTENRTTGGNVEATTEIGYIQVWRDEEGTVGDENWMMIHTENGNGIILDSGDNLLLQVQSGKVIGLGTAEGGQVVQIGMANNYDNPSKTELFGRLFIKPLYQGGSAGNEGQCLYSGGSENPCYWAEAPWTQIDWLANATNARGYTWHGAVSAGYRAILVIGHLSSTYTETSIVLPIHSMDGQTRFQISDESYYMSFVADQDSITFKASNNSDAGIDTIFGIK